MSKTNQVNCILEYECPVCYYKIGTINECMTCRCGLVHCPNCNAELDKTEFPKEWLED